MLFSAVTETTELTIIGELLLRSPLADYTAELENNKAQLSLGKTGNATAYCSCCSTDLHGHQML